MILLQTIAISLLFLAFNSGVLADLKSPGVGLEKTSPEVSESAKLNVFKPDTPILDGNVRFGIPFERGKLKANSPVSLFSSSGEQHPTQSKILSKWNDGSVRWLLVDGQIPESVSRLSLKEVLKADTIDNPLRIESREKYFLVDTGVIRFEVPRDSGRIIGRVWAGQDQVIVGAKDNRGPYVTLEEGRDFFGANLSDDSKPLSHDPIARYIRHVKEEAGIGGNYNLYSPWDLTVTVEESGPIHGVIRISGTHLDQQGLGFGQFIIRLHAFRGSSEIRLDHSFVFTGDAESRIRSYGFSLPFMAKQSSIEGRKLKSGALYQMGHDRYSVGDSSKELSGKSKGYIIRQNGNKRIAVYLQDMAELYPKAISASENGLRVELYPEASEAWDLARYSKTIDIKNGESDYPRDRGAQGLATSNSYFIDFSAGKDQLVEQRARQIQAGPMVVRASPSWYEKAGVLGIGPFVFPTSLKTSEAHYRIDRFLKVIEEFMRYNQRIKFNWYGHEQYGDIRGLFDGGKGASHRWSEKGRYGWSGNSGEPSNKLWVQHLRSPSHASYLDAEALARHTMNKQMVHYGDADITDGSFWSGRNNSFVVGSLHRHGVQAWSGYAGLPQYSHLAGVETYYYLTGDQRAKEVLFEAAQFIHRYGGSTNPEYTALVNGIDVLDRAAAVFFDQPEIARRFQKRVKFLVDHLRRSETGSLVEALRKSNILDGFSLFTRGVPGLLYRHERTNDPHVAKMILAAADFLVSGDDGDVWGLTENGSAGHVLYHLNLISYARHIGADYQHPTQRYEEFLQNALAWNTHARESVETGAISLQSIQNFPSDWKNWKWDWDEEPLSDPPGILWLAHQLSFRDNHMQDYHSYRAFVHLATLAASVEPKDAQLR